MNESDTQRDASNTTQAPPYTVHDNTLLEPSSVEDLSIYARLFYLIPASAFPMATLMMVRASGRLYGLNAAIVISIFILSFIHRAWFAATWAGKGRLASLPHVLAFVLMALIWIAVSICALTGVFPCQKWDDRFHADLEIILGVVAILEGVTNAIMACVCAAARENPIFSLERLWRPLMSSPTVARYACALSLSITLSVVIIIVVHHRRQQYTIIPTLTILHEIAMLISLLQLRRHVTNNTVTGLVLSLPPFTYSTCHLVLTLILAVLWTIPAVPLFYLVTNRTLVIFPALIGLAEATLQLCMLVWLYNFREGGGDSPDTATEIDTGLFISIKGDPERDPRYPANNITV